MLAATAPSPWWTVLATVVGGLIVMFSNFLIERRRSSEDRAREKRRHAEAELARLEAQHAEVSRLFALFLHHSLLSSIVTETWNEDHRGDEQYPESIEGDVRAAFLARVDLTHALTSSGFLASAPVTEAASELQSCMLYHSLPNQQTRVEWGNRLSKAFDEWQAALEHEAAELRTRAADF